MKLFVIGTFSEASKTVTLSGEELLSIFQPRPEVVILEDYELDELWHLAEAAAMARIKFDPTLSHFGDFTLEPEIHDFADQQAFEALYGEFVRLCDDEALRIFIEMHEPSDEDRYAVANGTHDVTTAITDALLRITGRREIAAD